MSTLDDRETLPATIKPINYELSLFDLEFGGGWSYAGVVNIDSKVTSEVQEIVLNVKELEINDVDVLGKDGGSLASMTDVSYDKKSERATIKLSKPISAGSASLSIKFKGTMNNGMAGFYRSKYKPVVTPASGTPKDDEYHYMLSTQFEACDARRAFPCFDEPNLKASLDLTLEIPDDLVALSNMPEKSVTKASKDGWKKVSFETTPTMSTYLAAWAIGDFEYVEAVTERKYSGKNMPVRVYTTRGLKEQGKFAAEHASKTVDYFSDIFGIEYPLPKSDLLAVHEFAMGAMENWGLVTYRTTAVLFDEEKSDDTFKNRVAYVVAHELAHQWFGNLVTMDWWNELWLNEGFATWVGWLAVDYIHPEWQVWSQFVTEGYQSALTLDSLRASHPIEVPVRNALEVDQIFDAISYLKGSSVIRMLSNHLGQEIFLKGVGEYLKKFAYGNARTDDLWAALSAASGQDVKAFMDPWIRKIGYPVVTVAEEPGQISIRQSRFLSTGDVQSADDETLWWIPVGLKTGSSGQIVHSALTQKEDTIRDVDDKFYKINADQSGFYRTNYPPQRLIKLGASPEKLSTEDKIGLIGDATALAVSGDGTASTVLALLEGMQKERDFLVWSQISASLTKLRMIFSSNTDISAGLKKFTLKLVMPAAEEVTGWDFPKDEDFLTGQLRRLLIRVAAGADHQGVIAEAQKRFAAWKNGDPKAIHQNLRQAIFSIAVANGGDEEYEAVKKEYRETTSVDGKSICLAALGKSDESRLAQDLLQFCITDVPPQDAHVPITAIAANNKTRNVAWEFTRDHWDQLTSRLAGANVVLDRWMRMGMLSFSDRTIAKEMSEFFKDKDTAAFSRTLVVAEDTINSNANFKDRDEATLLEWLATHGYA